MVKKRTIDTETLLKYLQRLSPEEALKQRLTPEKMIRINIYCQELVRVKQLIDEAKADIDLNGGVEIFIQGEQRLRRRNPAMQNFLENERFYFTLIGRLENIIDSELILARTDY